jgi:hypothetical protein
MSSRVSSLLTASVLSLLVTGCEGTIWSSAPSDPGAVDGPTGSGGPSAGAPLPFSCDAAAPPAPTVTHRLTMRQLQRTLGDELGRFVGADPAAALVGSAWSSAGLPADTERYERWSNDFSSAHAQAVFVLADALAKGVAQSAPKFTASAIAFAPGACATFDATSAVCQSQLIRNVGLRLLRRPLAATEVDDYRLEYSGGLDATTALSNLVFRMLLAPGSLFQLEVNEDAVPGRSDQLMLSSYALANRLSYAFWNAPPDEMLLQLASSGSLQDDAAFARALQYVVSQNDRFVGSTDEFFDDWLRLDKVPVFQSNAPATFALYAGDLTYDSNLRADMQREVRELGSFITRESSPLDELFTSEVSFARSPGLMKLYGVSTPAATVVTGASAVKLPQGQRPGLLTRAAMLVTAAGNKNPVLRGVRVLTDVLCMAPPPPPANLPAGTFAVPPYDESLTARERYAVKTSVQPCLSCHQRINLPGYGLSNYNGLARFETTEPAFKADGSYAGTQLPVDATVDLSALFGAGVNVETPVDLGQLLAARRETRACFTQQYGRFFLGRELSGSDGCALAAFYGALVERRPLREAMQVLASQPAFRIKQL